MVWNILFAQLMIILTPQFLGSSDEAVSFLNGRQSEISWNLMFTSVPTSINRSIRMYVFLTAHTVNVKWSILTKE